MNDQTVPPDGDTRIWHDSSRSSGWARPALMFDLPVALLLLVGWFSLSMRVSHLIAGFAFAAVVGVHLSTRPGLRRGLRHGAGAHRSGPHARRRWQTWPLIASAAVMTVSGILQWSGIEAMIPVHAGSSGLLIILAVVHIWQRRRVLSARMRASSVA